MRETRRAMILLVMGVTGAGKSTVGKRLAERLGWVFLEADDFHSAANKEKMRRGEPLTDADRWPWLDAIHDELGSNGRAGRNVVLACSALKEEYRKRLTAGLEARLVYLKGSQELIGERLRARTGHFAGESILEDQFEALEEPAENGVLVEEVTDSPREIVEKVLAATGLVTRGDDGEYGRALIAKIRWRLLPFLFLLYVVAYLDRINVGFAALQMKGQLGFSDAVYGLGAGIFFLGYFLFQVPSNVMLQRAGARRWIGTLMILWGVISSAMFLIHSAWSFYALRFLLGAAEAGFFPGVIYYLRSWFPAETRAGVVALFMTAGPVSGIIGGPISGALLDWGAPGGLAGWQWMFLMEGIPAIALGVAAWMLLSNGPEDARWLGEKERSWLREKLAASMRGPAKVSDGNGPRAWYLAGRLWRLGLVYFGLNTCTYGISLWLPSALKSLSGLPNVLLGIVSAVPYVVAVVAMIIIGMHSDRTGERRKHVAGSAIAGAGALLVAGVSPGLAVSVAAFGVALAASSAMTGPFWAMASGVLAESTAAPAIALINSIGNLGSGFGPYWIGYLRDRTHGFQAGLWSVAGMMALAAGLVMTVAKEGKHKSARV